METSRELFQLLLVTSLHPSAKLLKESFDAPFPINVPKLVTESVCQKGVLVMCEILQNAMIWLMERLLLNHQLTQDECDKSSLLVSSLVRVGSVHILFPTFIET